MLGRFTGRSRETAGATIAIAPALVLVGFPTIASIVFSVIESTRSESGVGLYRDLLAGDSQVTEFWESAAFTVMVGVVSTALSGVLALLLVSWWHQNRSSSPSITLYSVVIGVPHLAWAAALFLWLSQSGLVARMVTEVGLIDQPADFPILVADNGGLGLIIHYVTKETPFIFVASVAALAARSSDLNTAAASLGANMVNRARFVTWPLVRPAILGSMLISFAFVLHSVEAPALLGASQPRMLAVVAAELFAEPTVQRRSLAAAIGMILTVVVLLSGALGAFTISRKST